MSETYTAGEVKALLGMVAGIDPEHIRGYMVLTVGTGDRPSEVRLQTNLTDPMTKVWVLNHAAVVIAEQAAKS